MDSLFCGFLLHLLVYYTDQTSWMSKQLRNGSSFFFLYFFLSWVILFYELSNNSNVVVSQLECNVNLNQSLFARIKSLHYYSFITTIIYILPFSWFPSRFKGLVIITLHPDHVKVFVDTWLCFYWVMSLCFGMRVKWSNI